MTTRDAEGEHRWLGGQQTEENKHQAIKSHQQNQQENFSRKSSRFASLNECRFFGRTDGGVS